MKLYENSMKYSWNFVILVKYDKHLIECDRFIDGDMY